MTDPEPPETLNAPFVLTFGVDIDRFYRKELRIDQDGQCRFYLQSNTGRPKLMTLGRFHAQIKAQEAREIRERVVALEEVPIPDQGPVPPGTPMYEVRLEQAGKVRSRSFDPYVIPPRFQVIGRRLLEIEEQSLDSPYAAVELQAKLLSESLHRGQRLPVQVLLKHAGTAPLSLINPLLSGDQKSGRLLITGTRSDIPEEELETVHRKAVELEFRHLAGQDPAHALPVLKLDASRHPAIALELVAPLDWPPGQYTVHCILELAASAGNPEVIAARFVSQPMPLAITGTVKPEDYPKVEYTPPAL